MLTARRLLMGGGGSFVPLEEGPMHGVLARFWDGTIGSSGQTIPNTTFTAIKYNYIGVGPTGGFKGYDTDRYHPHTTDSNLTGTVTKTATSPVIAGSGTSFLSELEVGDAVRVPGGETYYPDVFVVKSIESDTQFTAYQDALYSGSGKTATKDSSVFVIPPGMGGYYAFAWMADWRADATGIRETNLIWNGFDNGNDSGSNYNGGWGEWTEGMAAGETVHFSGAAPMPFAEGEFVQMFVWQSSGGPLQFAADAAGYMFGMWRVGT